MQVFFVCRQVIDLVGHLALLHLAVRSLDETKLVDAGKGGQRTNQTNVWSFWSFNRTHAAVVRRVHVADFEASALTRQTTGAKGRKTTLVGQT